MSQKSGIRNQGSEIDPIRDEELIKFSALLDVYTAHQREAALTESRRNRITMIRTLGDGHQVHFEAIVDESAPSSEIYDCIKRADDACNRVRAAAILTEHYNYITRCCNEIDLSTKKLRDERIDFERKNARRSANRRQDIVGLTEQQEDALRAIRDQIKDTWNKIEQTLEAASQTHKMLDGEEPNEVLLGEIEERLKKLRPHREAA